MTGRKTLAFLGAVIVLSVTSLFLIAGNDRAAAAGGLSASYLQQGNLLQNPGFEGRFRAWNSIPEVQVAAKWTPWWWEDPDHNPAYFRPEYKQALAAVFPKRVLSGESAQQWFTFHASHVAGMYQQIFDVTPGQRYRFSIWAQVWSSSEDNPHQSVLPANPHLQIGIDPTGNWSASAPTVLWSGEAPMSGVIDQWGLMTLEATAENNIITVFMRTNPDFANKHNDMYWDNAGLEAVAPAPPTAPPSPTAAPATNTPTTTSTSPLTDTPAATDTPQATATITRMPSSTPTEEAATPTATATASPTPTTTSTPVPSRTPEPTLTPTSTRTPTASPTIRVDATDSYPPAIVENRVGDSESQPTENAVEPDDSGIITLMVVAAVIVLLILLIFLLVRRFGRQQS
ncbi:MAG: hypothetical protein PVH18_12815 [Chloroflexota bacterium]|jgi:hypothetical protein